MVAKANPNPDQSAQQQRSAEREAGVSPPLPAAPLASPALGAEHTSAAPPTRTSEGADGRAGSVNPWSIMPGLDRARWMSQFGEAIGDCGLTQVAMVGAHDACTYNISREAPGEYAPDAPEGLVNIAQPLQGAAHRLAAGWARTQEHSMRAMLQLGVRYFDLRVSPRGPTKELWITHGLYSVPLASVIEDVAGFFGASVSLHPGSRDVGVPATFEGLPHNREVVVLDVQRLSGIQSGFGSAKIHHEFFRLLETLRPLLLKEGQSIATPLREFWATGTRVVLLYPCALACAVHRPLVLPRTREYIRSEWFNKNDARELTKLLSSELIQRRNGIVSRFVTEGPEGPSSAEPLHVLQAILSPATGDFVRMLVSPLPGTFRKVEDFAHFVNSKVLTLWATHAPVPDGPDTVGHDGQQRPRHLSLDGRNVLMLDFFAQGRDEVSGLDAVQLCFYVNAQRFGVPGDLRPWAQPLAPLERIVGADAMSPTMGGAHRPRPAELPSLPPPAADDESDGDTNAEDNHDREQIPGRPAEVTAVAAAPTPPPAAVKLPDADGPKSPLAASDGELQQPERSAEHV